MFNAFLGSLELAIFKHASTWFRNDKVTGSQNHDAYLESEG